MAEEAQRDAEELALREQPVQGSPTHKHCIACLAIPLPGLPQPLQQDVPIGVQWLLQAALAGGQALRTSHFCKKPLPLDGPKAGRLHQTQCQGFILCRSGLCTELGKGPIILPQ